MNIPERFELLSKSSVVIKLELKGNCCRVIHFLDSKLFLFAGLNELGFG